ncbi:nitroreductase [Candidatus Bathyarchaeota archaeon]|jgi:nitroreductase|nr:nitroreductase [Candidatus Bathyarchaeota archaeon]MDP6049072.1 nitroreductase [Candidatus Bathyarchaeota archaeon]MDP7443334.1 nitroreductase [Candidatus Bathyarchaeota archaeon]|tara:strand:+ start:2987 stop:3487 length:501 start_codon:yes stop_codon:yes gene_type:complete
MDVMDAILKRRSTRSFTNKPVPNEVVERLLEAARWAPSGGNRQNWRFIEIRNPRRLDMIKMFSAGLKGDPTLIIAICGKISEPMNLLDIGMASENIMLEAVELGLGSCAIVSYSEGPVKQFLGVPDDLELILVLSIGYPDKIPKPRPKKPLNEIAFSEKFGEEFGS